MSIAKTHRLFLWGASTSSYQVEGGIVNNDWDFFTRSDSIKKRLSSLTKPNLLYKDSTQVHLQAAGDAVKSLGSQLLSK